MMLELLLGATLRMLLLGAVLWLTLRVVRVRNPHVESLAWRMLLLAGLAMPALLYSGLAPSVAMTLELPVVLAGQGAAGMPALETSQAFAGVPAGVLASIYIVVTLLLLGRLAAGLLSLWRVAAHASPMATPDDVRITSRLRSPATFGTIILLPSDSQDWPAQQHDAVLAHERAHVRSRDGYWSWLAQFNAAIFWFNPLAWWLRRRLDTLAETTSDDAVVAARHDPIAYAALLLDFARRPNTRRVAMSVAESNVPGRIERLLARTPPGSALSRRTRWGVFAACVPAIVLAASTTQAIGQAQPASPATGAVKITRAADPDQFYPQAARQANASALVVVQVDVDPQGRVVGASVLEPLRENDPHGFADAAIEVARHSQFSNPNAAVTSMKFMVKFAPASAPPSGNVRLTVVPDPDDFYPDAARQANVSGSAIVQVAVDPKGRIVDVSVLETRPAGDSYGFGAAAVEVARKSQYSNPGTEISSIKFMVKFDNRT